MARNTWTPPYLVADVTEITVLMGRGLLSELEVRGPWPSHDTVNPEGGAEVLTNC